MEECRILARHACMRAVIFFVLRRLPILALLLILSASAAANHLGDSADPYLRMHAHDPVDWYPWGAAALEKARREHKLIFLSIGYLSCYWCHVADRELFSDPSIARLMNRWFVNILVDREQRPDLDRVYQLAAVVMNGRGGWPNNLFLTPDLKPFYVGTYFSPRDDSLGAPAFVPLLRRIHREWGSDPAAVMARADAVVAKMRAQGGSAGDAKIQPRCWLQQAVATSAAHFDWRHGGLPAGAAQAKFPRPPLLALWLSAAVHEHDPRASAMLRETLDAMAYGGIHDALGGGFHRYAIDPAWSLPHFEKMLSGNAQLLAVYARAWARDHDPLYLLVALDTAAWLARRLQTPAGGFYAGMAAATHGEKGAYYLWTRQEIDALLGTAGARRFFELYALTPISHPSAEALFSGEIPGVLRVREALESLGGRQTARRIAALAPERERLLAARQKRPRPQIDRLMPVGLNGLAIGAFAQAGLALHRPQLTGIAARAAERIWRVAWQARSRTLAHALLAGRPDGAGLLADYALFGNGLLDLYHNDRQPRWLHRARRLGDALLARFRRPDGALMETRGDASLPVAPRATGDIHRPSALSAAIVLLLRLGELTHDPRYTRAAREALRNAAPAIAAAPERWGYLLARLNDLPSPVREALAAPTGVEAAGGGFHIATSAEAVSVLAERAPVDGRPGLVLRLRIAPGYHINADPASLPYLIPTQVRLENLTPVRVHYPEGRWIHPAISREGLRVYTGEATIRVVLPPGATPARAVRGTLRIQACKAQVCLPPASLSFRVGK